MHSFPSGLCVFFHFFNGFIQFIQTFVHYWISLSGFSIANLRTTIIIVYLVLRSFSCVSALMEYSRTAMLEALDWMWVLLAFSPLDLALFLDLSLLEGYSVPWFMIPPYVFRECDSWLFLVILTWPPGVFIGNTSWCWRLGYWGKLWKELL